MTGEMRKSHRLPELDTIRGFAFLLVVLSHIGNVRNLPTRGLGQFGVWIFFVLSAFLLSYPFFENDELVVSHEAWARYFIRRVCRIWPPYLAALCLFHFVRHWTWSTVLLDATFQRGTEIMWTVFIEVRYYLILPPIVYGMYLLRKRPVLLCVCLVGELAANITIIPFWRNPSEWWIIYKESGAPGGWEGELGFLQYLPLFIAGTALALFRVRISAVPKLATIWRKYAPSIFIVTALAMVMFSPSGMSALRGVTLPFSYGHEYWVPFAPVISLFIVSATFLTGRIERLITKPYLRYIGEISYSGYLLHIIFIERFAAISNDLLFLLSVLISSFIAAIIAHWFIENPFIRIGRLF